VPECKLCRRNVDALINAHVIPRSFWEIDPSLPAPKLITNTTGIYPKKAPIGIYDQTIVCEQCERRFSAYDAYAARLLLQSASEFEAIQDDDSGDLSGYLVRQYDYGFLKMFIIALLWRASVAAHPFFSRVRLGPFEEKARKMLLAADPGDAQTFGTLLSIWVGGEWPMIMDPFRERLFNVLSYRFYLGRYVAYIKVDQQNFPGEYTEGILNPDRPLYLIARAWSRSKELDLANKITEIHAARLPRRPLRGL
jgi:hypothetical protein